MSHPRVTVTVGRTGQRSATISPVDAHSNRLGGVILGNKKRSVKDRLGNNALSVSANSYQINKRQRQDINWKPKFYTNAGPRGMMLDSQNPRNDLRYKLEQKNLLRARQLSNGIVNPVNDLRTRISGTPQHAQGQRLIVRKPPSLPLKTVPAVRSLPQPATAIASRIKAVQSVPVAVEQPTVATLLQSLGLGKYSIMFQAEEVDMAALRNMTDDDLKELGLPMGPRKKILLALSARK